MNEEKGEWITGLGVIVLFGAIAAAAIRLLAYSPANSYYDFSPAILQNGTLYYGLRYVNIPAHFDFFTAGVIIAIASAICLIIIGSFES